jgi:hypothetical protein
MKIPSHCERSEAISRHKVGIACLPQAGFVANNAPRNDLINSDPFKSPFISLILLAGFGKLEHWGSNPNIIFLQPFVFLDC